MPTLQQIPIDKVTASPFQARKSFDVEALKELAQSMKSEGLIQPITVRSLPDGRYELVAGERRLRAAKQLGWPAIDAVVQAKVKDLDAALRGLIENLMRSDLNPIERAEGYKRLEEMGLTLEAVAQKTGVGDKSTISRFLALLELPQVVQDLLARANISVGQCRFIALLSTQAEQVAFAKTAAEQGWSVKETERRVNQIIGHGPKPIVHPPAPIFSAGGQSFTFSPRGQHFTIVTEPPRMDMLDVFMQNTRSALVDYMSSLPESKAAAAPRRILAHKIKGHSSKRRTKRRVRS